MSHTVLDLLDSSTLSYIITHVFCPPRLPRGDDHSVHNDHTLARVIASTGRLYGSHVGEENITQWHSVVRMLHNLHVVIQSDCMDKLQIISLFSSMDVGDVLAFLIRAQNAGVIFRRQKDVTIFESFEVSPKAKDVMAAEGKLICSYPGPAIEIPNFMLDDNDFVSELVNFLIHMDEDDLDGACATSQKEAPDFRDTVHPRYITELLTGILRSVGRPADIPRISKRVGDDVVCDDYPTLRPWRRSSVWLLIRVALQTTLHRSSLGQHTYKEFMLFFMCCLVEGKTCADLPSDLLHFMSAKISQRLRKLGPSAPDWLSRAVLETCTSLRSIIEDRWKQVQDTQGVSPRWDPSQLKLALDIQPSLLHSTNYLRNALANQSATPLKVPFSPKYISRGTLDQFLSAKNFFEEAYRFEPYVALYDVERAVEQGIDAWVGRVRNNDKACEKLERLADIYSSSALKTYAGNPELLSVMLLTKIELWIALDKIAVREISILAEYSPEVPTTFLEKLLLRKASSLDRLRRAHQYLSSRHSKSKNQWTVFSSTTTADSFAVRFYNKSWLLRYLKTRIEGTAQRQVRKKIAEMQEKNRKTILPKYDPNIWHIEVYRLPLPADQFEAAAIVFELDCPISFNMWRAATFGLLVDPCSVPAHLDGYTPVNCYQPLQPYVVKHPRARIALGFKSSLRDPRTTTIPASRDRVCLPNNLSFSVFDTHTGIPVSKATSLFNSIGYCTYKLPIGRYHNLQKYVDSTSHTSNEVIANQADCHKDLSIHEYVAFGHLRSGGFLQWLNILRELRARSLSFRRPEVHMLLAQAISQVGPLGDTGWAWHQEIQQPTFCDALLRELESLIQSIEANWLEAVMMDTISFLLRRLLASNADEAVSLKALDLLRIVRGKVFAWIQVLSATLMRTPGDEETGYLLRDIAAICRGTFDIDPIMIPKSLHSTEDVEVLLTSAMINNLHTPNDVSHLSAYSRLLIDRDRRLSLVLERVVNAVIQTSSGGQGVNLAVKRIWPDHHPGSEWTPMRDPCSHWFSSTTAPPADRHPQVIYLNILDGSLLIDGKSFGTWLPNEFVRHPLYKVIFGEQMLEVIPSDLPGMGYSTCNLVSGHQIYLSLRNKGSDLVIRAKRIQLNADHSGIIELIPHDKLESDLPTVLIDGHAHWLDLSTSTMEIRPLDKLWEASAENWRISCAHGRYRVQKGPEYLVDIRSRSWNMVSSLLRPLSSPQDILVSVCPVDASRPASSLQLFVVLPSYNLSFYVDEDGELQSRDVRGMVYDKNQSIGTLFGLANQLVLRPKIKDARAVELVPRCVLIPEGEVSSRMGGYHVRVEISPNYSGHKRIAYHTYHVNTDLGCLTGNGSLTSRLYCAYLHALTSGCSADPLIGRTGTEEALSLLRSACCWSAMRVCSRDVELLKLIAAVWSPRTWYREQIIQKVEWRNLPANSQNHELYIVSKAIKEHYEMLQSFRENQSSPSFDFRDFPSHDNHLLRRSAYRVAFLSSLSLSGQPSRANFDIQYPARDLIDCAPGEHRAYAAAMYIRHRTTTTTKNICEMVKSWENVHGDTTLSFHYDSSWFSPGLQLTWLKTYNLLRESGERQRSQMLFSIPAMAYGSENLVGLVPVFMAFASHAQFRLEDPPPYEHYSISEECSPSLAALKSYVVECAYPFGQNSAWLKAVKSYEGSGDTKQQPFEIYEEIRDSDADETARRLLATWPCQIPPSCSLSPQLYNVETLAFKIQCHFSNCYRNSRLKEHLTGVQEILNSLRSPTPDTPQYSFHPAKCAPYIHQPPAPDPLFTKPAPLLSTRNSLSPHAADPGSALPSDLRPLRQLIATVGADAENPFQLQYISTLRASAECQGNKNFLVVPRATELPTTEVLVEYYAQCRAGYIEALHLVQRNLGPESQSEQAIEQSGQWPCITAYALFRCLSSNSSVLPSDDWKKCLIKLALLALELQRARRLLLLYIDGLHEEFRRELQNKGCDGWNAESHSDWLLIQLQSNFLIRRVQAEVANEMMSPQSGENTTMQLNMGEGKTSVIIPIVAAILADGNQLVRVIVPKPLITQTLHLLADRLGGLTNRRIYYLPLSRSLRLNHERVTSLHRIMLDCMRDHGVLVLQPEHILSLRLSGVEKQLAREEEDRQTAHHLIEIQRWLHSHSRDILDESDETLDVRSQLVFTIGHQQQMDGSPDRWTTIQQILGFVSKHASLLRESFPFSVEYEPGPPGSFPGLRILQTDAGQTLISLVVQDVLQLLLLNFTFEKLASSIKDAIRCFISCEDVPPAIVRMVKEYSQNSPLWSNLLLLRGLLSNGILLFVFRERRWRVNYGLSLARTMLAVPYRAKDDPAQRAEFGHPDVAIILTCLSYYYGGLSEGQLKQAFEILFTRHDPSLDYDSWVRSCPAVPEYLQSFSRVNIESAEQWNKFLFPLFSRNRSTINFYLMKVVFPKEAKEFPSKLSSSSWDIAEKKERLLTGFSGTNDGQYLLPLHVSQRDAKHQQGTNAKVLSHLLLPENNHYMCMAHEKGERRTTPEFLQILVAQTPQIRVLLDVGAQMLDLENHELAAAWLDIDPNASAAVYFNEDDELVVRTRDGSTQLLRSSPFAQQLDRCVTYLDDAHTRGTDIKFPSVFRAAVTLGPKVTKDRLVQGCMRMRKLGHGQSIMFFAPLEVDQSIRSVARKGSLDLINTSDILHWAIRETWRCVERLAPQWVQQGIDHRSRYAAWSSFCSGQLTSEELSEKWVQPEAKRLEELYLPNNSPNTIILDHLDLLQRGNLGVQSLCSVALDEEQEREFVYEVQREQKIELTPRAQPACHSIHPDVVDFIKTGVIPTTSSPGMRSRAFKPAFDVLDTTSAAMNEAYVWSQSVLVTTDFEETVKTLEKMDNYLRPVHWIVSTKKSSGHLLVILSPYEVNCLLPDIRSSSKVHLHLYTPRITKAIKSCDDLSLYNIPRIPNGWILPSPFMDQLSVFAGQLYLKDYESYIRLCRFLNVYARDLHDEDGIVVESDAFIQPKNRDKSTKRLAHTFQRTPTASLRELINIRSNGVDSASTHMGRLLRGQPLSESDFDG